MDNTKQPDIALFLAAINERLTEHYRKQWPGLFESGMTAQVRAESGPKFHRIVKFDKTNTSAYCFIDRQTGDIYKADSWKKPAKGIRGNIADPNFGWGTALNEYGAVYRR